VNSIPQFKNLTINEVVSTQVLGNFSLGYAIDNALQQLISPDSFDFKTHWRVPPRGYEEKLQVNPVKVFQNTVSIRGYTLKAAAEIATFNFSSFFATYPLTLRFLGFVALRFFDFVDTGGRTICSWACSCFEPWRGKKEEFLRVIWESRSNQIARVFVHI
jgi:hypothetical protein